jgi:decaprenylphospho-beta-D-ribofuranose 2-oxidase
MIKDVTNWNNYPVQRADLQYFDHIPEAENYIAGMTEVIPRGLGRCYGDASLNNNILSTLKFDKALFFDDVEGIFECQSGMSLDEILKIIVPRGWFLPVTPGTKFVTIGGAVASDIHGKNHHRDGSFSNHIISMDVLTGSGSVITCSPDRHEDLFQATCGGMGLTGLVTKVRFKLKPIESAYISQTQLKARNLEELLEFFEVYNHFTYSVAWIDCLQKGKNFGRSILMLGESAILDDLTPRQRINPFKIHGEPGLSIPFNFPEFTLNNLTVKAFNALFYAKNIKQVQVNTVHYDPYFYPLDNIHSWNRMYGKKGFVQYQFVVPMTEKEGLIKIMQMISNKNMGSFLTVLKVFGPQDSLISFPMEGFTLALDFPLREGLFHFLDDLDKVVMEHGGRVYLTKDARMDAQLFKSTYPHYDQFNQILHKYNPEHKFASLLSRRLSINS